MGLFSSFRKKEEQAKPEQKKMILKMFTLLDDADVMDAVEHVKLGTTIAFFKLKNRELTKSALVSLKTACHSVNGEIVGLPDGWFVAAPSSIEIIKKSANAGKQVAQAMIEKEKLAKEMNQSMDDRIIVLDEIDTL
ncbi:MAG: hypothetical protein PHO02_06960 [Candidatus Nanoarchaeia archaeon]|nr:hypothetical protein [Candidatus Nanoarchaeia archaeon]